MFEGRQPGQQVGEQCWIFRKTFATPREPASSGGRPKGGRKRGRCRKGGWRAASRPKGVPGDWVAKPSKTGGGTRFVDPSNPHNSLRVMPGNPDSPFPNSQSPHVRVTRNGQAIDNAGNVVPKNSPDAHIPLGTSSFLTEEACAVVDSVATDRRGLLARTLRYGAAEASLARQRRDGVTFSRGSSLSAFFYHRDWTTCLRQGVRFRRNATLS